MYIYVCVCIHMCVYISLCVYMCVYVCVYVCVCVCVYVCVYIYIKSADRQVSQFLKLWKFLASPFQIIGLFYFKPEKFKRS